MSDRLLAILRQPRTSVALVSRKTGSTDDVPDYLDDVVPLAQLSQSLCPWRDRDVRAWRALAKVPRMSRKAGTAIVRSIIGSVADPAHRPAEVPGDLGSAGLPSDLRPYLCHPVSEQKILDSLGPALDLASKNTEFPHWHWSRRVELARLAPEFQRSFLWSLHLSPWTSVEATHQCFLELDLSSHPRLCRTLARMLSLAGPDRFAQWTAVLANIPATTRLPFAVAVNETSSFTERPTSSDVAIPTTRYADMCAALRQMYPGTQQARRSVA